MVRMTGWITIVRSPEGIVLCCPRHLREVLRLSYRGASRRYDDMLVSSESSIPNVSRGLKTQTIVG